MNKHIDYNIKLNPQIMNNVRMRKSAFSTLCRGGLICLLFLMPWFSNLQAQHLGTVGIDPLEANRKATLNILDDDNLNAGQGTVAESAASRDRRTITIKSTSYNVVDGYDGIEGTRNVKFIVHFKNRVGDGTTTASTTAKNPVWVEFEIQDGTAKLGEDFSRPTTSAALEQVGGSTSRKYKILIPASKNGSAEIELPVLVDNLIEGDEIFKIKLTAAEALPSIDSRVDGVATIFPLGADYDFKIKDVDDTPANKTLTITAAAAEVLEGNTTTYTVKLPIKTAVNVPFKLLVTGSATNGVDYNLNPSASGSPLSITSTIGANSNSVTITLNTIHNLEIEGDETVILTRDAGFALLTGYTWGIPNSATVTIKDKDDTPANKVVTLKIDGANSTTLTRGSVNGVITATIPLKAKHDIVVNLPQSGASSITDYNISATTIKIVAGDVSAAVNVNITPLCNDINSDKVLTIAPAKQSDGGLGYSVTPTNLTATIKKIGVGTTFTSSSGSNSICFGEEMIITAPDAPVGSKYQWMLGGANVGTQTTNNTIKVLNTTPVNTYSYSVNITTPENCLVARGPYVVMVKPQPAKVEIYTATSNICGTGSATIDVIQPNPKPADVTYYWYKKKGSGGAAELIGTNMLTYLANETVLALTTYYYWVEAEHSDGLCRTIGDEISVAFSPGGTVIDVPKIVSTPELANLCGGSVTLTALNSVTNGRYSDNAVYHWSMVGSVAPPVERVGDNTYHPTTSGHYRVTVYEGGCPSNASASKEVSGTVTSPIVKPIISPSGIVEICGDAQTLTVTNRPDNTYDVVWFQSGIGGGEITTARNNVSYTAPAGFGYYVKFEKAGCISVQSEVVTVKKKSNATNLAKPEIQPDPATSNCGGRVTLNVDNLSDFAVGQKFQWYNASGIITGATGNSYYAGNGRYYVVATADNIACGGPAESVGSKIVTVTITGTAGLAKPKITSAFDPADPEICNGPGAVVLLTAVSTGSAYTNVEYLWYVGASATEMNYLATTTGNTYSATTKGYYTVVVKTTAGGACVGEEAKSDAREVKASANTIDFDAPVITKRAGSGECAGGSITLMVSNPHANAAANDYQWFLNGVVITKAGQPGYGKGTSFAATDNGDYKVILTMGGCSAESNTENVNLTGGGSVPVKPDLQPSIAGDLEFCDGGSGSTGNFKLYVANATTYTDVEFEWYHTGYGPGAITDALGNTYTQATLFLPMNGTGGKVYGEGTYYVVAKNKNSSCQSIPSDYREVKKSVNTTDLVNPTIVSNVVGDKFCDGGSVTLRITNTDQYAGKTVTYTWYTLANPTAPVSTGSSQHFATTEGYYYAEVKEGNCVAYSNVIHVEKSPNTTDLKKPVITSKPANGEICMDNGNNKGSVELKATQTGGGDYAPGVTFEWYLDGNPLPASYGNGSIILTSEKGFYTVAAKSGSCQSVGSDRFEVKISTTNTAPIAAEIKPDLYTLSIGGTVILKAEPISGGTFAAGLKFEWYRLAGSGDAPLMPGTPIAFNSTTIPECPTIIAGEFIVVVVDGVDCRSDFSNTATVIEGTSFAPIKPYIVNMNPGGSTVICNGGSIELKAVPDNDRSGEYPGDFTFIWYVDKNDGNGKQLLSTIAKIHHATDEGGYYVVAKNNVGDLSPESDKYALTKDLLTLAPNKPDIAASSTTICENGSVVLMAKHGGNPYPTTGYTFKWYKNTGGSSVPIGTTTEISTFVYNWTAGDPATISFTVKVLDANCESDISSSVTVTASGQTVPNIPVLSTYNDRPLVICEDGTVTLIVTGVSGEEYHWYKVGDHIPAITNEPMHTVDSHGSYYVVVASRDGVNICYSHQSNIVIVAPSGNTINPTAPAINAVNTKLCLDGVVRVTATGAPVGVAGYRWYLRFSNGNYKIEETTEAFLDITETREGNIEVEVSYFDSQDCVSKPSAKINITVDAGTSAPSVTIDSNGMGDFCAGLEVELKVPAGYDRYIWYLNDVQLATTTNIHKAQAAGTYKVYVYSGTAPTACVGMDTLTLNDGGGNCIATYVELIVGATELQEGTSTTVTARLKNNLAAINDIMVDLTNDPSDKAFISTTGTCPLPALNGGLSDYTLPSFIKIPALQRSAQVTLQTCLDEVYEGNEVLTIIAKVGTTHISTGSPAKVTIKDNQANPDGSLNLGWTVLTPMVIKGDQATFELRAEDPHGNPVKVQRDEKVGLSYLVTSTAEAGTHFIKEEWAVIPAGQSSGMLNLQTRDDNVVETDRILISDIETLHSKINPAQQLIIRSIGVNPLGGFDFKVTLTPNDLIEGESFALTIALDASPQSKLGSEVAFNISEMLGSIAKLGVDYELPDVRLYKDDNTRTFLINTIDNDIYDGSRRMDIRVSPVDPTHQIVSMLPNPLSGVIKDNDKLCLTITSDLKGIDDLETMANVTVTAGNLAATAGGIVVQLNNQNSGRMDQYHQPVGEFSIPFTLTSATPTYEFTVTSTLQPPTDIVKKNFKVDEYVTIYEEMIIVIQNINAADLDCYAPLKIIISDDFDRDRLPNWLERGNPNCAGSGDTNDNGILNEWDPYDPNADDDKDGIPNWMEDTNRDGNPYNDFASLINCLPNFANADSDNDGVPDTAEKWTNRPYDDNEGDIRIHPALSLNDDGIGNDFLFIENIEKYPGNKVTVFDRQGIVVFETKEYKNTPDTAFRGIANKGKTGKKIPMGTYFVIVEYTKDNSKKYYDKAIEVRY